MSAHPIMADILVREIVEGSDGRIEDMGTKEGEKEGFRTLEKPD